MCINNKRETQGLRKTRSPFDLFFYSLDKTGRKGSTINKRTIRVLKTILHVSLDEGVNNVIPVMVDNTIRVGRSRRVPTPGRKD